MKYVIKPWLRVRVNYIHFIHSFRYHAYLADNMLYVLLIVFIIQWGQLSCLTHDDYLKSCYFSNETSRSKPSPDEVPLSQSTSTLSRFNKYQGDMDIYWINLDASNERRRVMNEHFNDHNYRHHRMKGYTMDDIYIPGDVSYWWGHNRPIVYSLEYPPPRHTLNSTSNLYNYSIVLSG